MDPEQDPGALAARAEQRRAGLAARRDRAVAKATEQARAALTYNANLRTEMAAWLATSPPGTTAERLVFLYDHLRAVSQALVVGSRETDGVIRLLGAVVTELSDLLDDDPEV